MDEILNMDTILADIPFPDTGDEIPTDQGEVVEDAPMQADGAPEVPEVEPVKEDPSKSYQEAIDKFDRTGNPHDLPEPLRRQELARQADYTRKMQEIASLRKQESKPEPAPSGPPKIDLDAEPDVLAKQISDLVTYQVEQATSKYRETAERYEVTTQEQKFQQHINGLQEHVKSQPGYTPEIEAKMAEVLSQHVDDPEWKTLMGTRVGLSMLFEKTKNSMGQAGAQDKAAQKAEDKLRSPAPAKNRQAEPMGIADRYKGLTWLEKLDKAVAERP
ncbi:MAG: hypothetical protein IPH09_13005 [bacterium]|nr:hypothetical protein [bacterium]